MISPHSLPKVDVVVSGHRDLFGTPRALEAAGLLRYLVTDLYVGRGSSLNLLRPLLPYGPKFFRKLLARDSGLPPERIVANNLAGLRSWHSLRKVHDPGAASLLHQRLAKDLAKSLLRRCPPFADAVVGYRMSDWLFSELPEQTAKILCQNDGGAHEVDVVGKVYDSNPDWRWPETGVDRSSAKHDIPDWLSIERERLKKEWRLANKIVCWSEWCVECVMQDGVPRDKCFVVPPMFEPSPAYASCAPRYEAEPFTVIFLGTLCLRKGTHDLIEAVALAAQSAPVRLILAGPNQLNPAMLKRHRDFIDYRGFIPHRELPSLLSQGHVLALPSYSEGFGMVQLEAMAAGLPVIRSTNTGDAARDGREGIALCAGDRNALANAILMLARDRQRLEEMSHMSRLRIDDFSMEATARRWHAVIMNLLT